MNRSPWCWVVQDATERFIAEERFGKTFNANPAPALICRLHVRRVDGSL